MQVEVYAFLMQNKGKRMSAKQIAEKMNQKYGSVKFALCELSKKGLIELEIGVETIPCDFYFVGKRDE